MSGAQFLPLIAIALLFWLLVIRPQSRRTRELRALQASLEVGDEVMLTSGILGVVSGLDDEHAHVQIAPGTSVKVVRGAIGTKIPQPLPPTYDTEHQAGPPSDGAARPEETN